MKRHFTSERLPKISEAIASKQIVACRDYDCPVATYRCELDGQLKSYATVMADSAMVAAQKGRAGD